MPLFAAICRKYILLLTLCLLALGLFGCQEEGEEAYPTISEVVSSNKHSLEDERYGSPDWIELVNLTEQPIDLSGFYLTDDIENPDKLSPLPSEVLQPGEYFLLYANKETGQRCLSFSLSKEGESLSLVNARRQEVCTLTLPPLPKDVSYARREDGSYGYCARPTPNGPNIWEITNSCPAASLWGEPNYAAGTVFYAPVINELISRSEERYLCQGCGRYTDIIELYNPHEEDILLSGYTLSGEEEENVRHNLPPACIPPGEYLLLYGCGSDCSLKEAHACMDFGLSRYGERVYIFDPMGNTLAYVELPALDKGFSYARRSDGSYGYSNAPSLGEANREESILEQMVPPQIPLGSCRVRLNEALADNRRSLVDSKGDRWDFAELYNPTDSPISLSGLYLSDNPQKLTKWALPDRILEGNSYLIILLSGKDIREGGELHASFSLKTGETLCLYDSQGGVMEQLPILAVEENCSIGREPGGALVFYTQPSPGYENGHGTPLN